MAKSKILRKLLAETLDTHGIINKGTNRSAAPGLALNPHKKTPWVRQQATHFRDFADAVHGSEYFTEGI